LRKPMNPSRTRSREVRRRGRIFQERTRFG
jgi:hypothetical protein